ncbi:MAG TPA: ferric reductase-like transmembrane domain-containing protein, partial [Candidatus Dormibacteraeota bacterium]|nr:ferric reductase-like transmembrane domain-containing protein [Candidatus Dormibacteraeota bacterium]
PVNSTLLWYTTRGAGVVSMVLLSGVMALGMLTRARAGGRRWPRFLTAALHRDLSLMALVFLGLHIVTAVVDPYTHLGITAALVPFGSSYRTLWLGLGTIALDLMLAIAATSLLRSVVGRRAWRAIHWLAYACWPVAVVHGLGTGTDAGSPWMSGITVLCVAGVLSAAAYRLLSPGDPLAGEKRATVRRAPSGAGR